LINQQTFPIEDLLFCQPLEGRTTGENFSVKLNEFFIANELSWNNCVGVCTDGAAAMTGERKGLFAPVRNLNDITDVIYTFIGWQWPLRKLPMNLTKSYKKQLL
jgi:hypothetical protein